MNKVRMRSLAKFLETKVPEENFNMEEWVSYVDGNDEHEAGDVLRPKTPFCETDMYTCGTAACITGWQVFKDKLCVVNEFEVVKPLKKTVKTVSQHIEEYAKHRLELDREQTYRLFRKPQWPLDNRGDDLFDNSPKGAAARIRHMVATGE